MTKKKKKSKQVSRGVVHVVATFNNTIVTVTDPQGNTLCWSSSGAAGFKGSKKSTPFAAQIASEQAAKKAMEFGLKDVVVHVKESDQFNVGRIEFEGNERTMDKVLRRELRLYEGGLVNVDRKSVV